MGEILFSICIGGLLIVSGIAMNVILRHEEKQFESDQNKGGDLG